MSRRNPAFTLIELLVAIGLMALLGVIIASIFFNSSEVFRRTQAKIDIYQHARYALNLMGRELSCTLAYNHPLQSLVIGTPNQQGNGRPGLYLSFATRTSYIDYLAGIQYTDIAQVAYKLASSSDPGQHILQREIYAASAPPPTPDIIFDASAPKIQTRKKPPPANQNLLLVDNLCEYVREFQVSYLSWYLGSSGGDRFVFPWPANPGGTWNISPELDRAFTPDFTGSQQNCIRFDAATKVPPQRSTRGVPAVTVLSGALIPSAIRLSLTVSDARNKETRLFSRTCWIPSANPPVQ